MKKFIEIIKNSGNKNEIKKAKEGIHSFWHGITRMAEKDNQKFEVFVDEIKTFDQIKNLDNQIHFIQVLIWPFLALADRQIEFFGDFILKHIQHPSAKVRQAIIRLAAYLSMSVTLNEHSWCKEKFSEKDLIEINNHQQLYFKIVQAAEKLLEKYDEPKFRKCEYISDLPTGVYKSIQYLITKELLRVIDTEVAYQKFLRGKDVFCNSNDIAEEAERIIARRKISDKKLEIETEILELLYLTGSDFEIEDIRRAIYEEENTDDLQEVIAMLDDGNLENLSNVLEIISDAWNYFPHRVLDGLSPAEKLLEYKNGIII